MGAGLHYWPLTPIQFSLSITGPLYALTMLSAGITTENIPLRRAVVFFTFALHALTRAAPWRAGPGIRAVREGWADARAGRLGKRRGSG